MNVKKLKNLNNLFKTVPPYIMKQKKKLGKMNTKKWQLSAQIRLEKYKIVNNSYIIPLIIPLTVSV